MDRIIRRNDTGSRTGMIRHENLGLVEMSRIRTQPPEIMVQSPLMFAPQPPTQSSLHPVKRSLSLFPCAEKETIVYYSSSAYPKQDMFLLLNPWGEDDFTKTHLQQVLKLYSKELPDKNYASNTRKQSTFLERCISKCKYCSLVLKSRLLALMIVTWRLEELIAMFVYGTFIPENMSMPLQVTGTLFLPYYSDTQLRSSTLVHLIEVSRSALTVGRDRIMLLQQEKAPYVAKANERKVEYEKTRNSELPESFTRRKGGEEEEKSSVLPKNDGCGCSLMFTV
ncbi:hypothetical protein HID58_055407 [Brassica napus]|uniref:Uncharacterized protein n=1 Tax=Brassica napus TaxID=3708 RepID=A0ABQ8AKN6_BRANA|nr:hypothetical protein HID58_055407 [Brassica napus]